MQMFVKPIMQQETTKTRYSDTELNEFRTLIKEKIGVAREELQELVGTLSASNTTGLWFLPAEFYKKSY